MREDKIISALIGLAGACNNNPKTSNTDCLIIKALAFPLICPDYDDKALQEIINEIHSEKNTISPGCAACAAPCGATSDYDMHQIYDADDKIREVKLRLLEKLQKLAFYAYHHQKPEKDTCIDNEFFYKALLYIGCDLDETALLKLLDEAEKIY